MPAGNVWLTEKTPSLIFAESPLVTGFSKTPSSITPLLVTLPVNTPPNIVPLLITFASANCLSYNPG